MANSTTNIDTIDVGVAQKEAIANALFDAFSPASQFGRRAATTTGLTWGYYGGVIANSGGVPTVIANGTLTLVASDTNYIYRTVDGVVTFAALGESPGGEPYGWPGPLADGNIALYEVVTGAATITSYTDYRLGLGGTAGPPGPTGAAGANWSVSVNAQTGTSYTLQASDNGKVITLSNGSAIMFYVPTGLGANFACELIQLGAGQVEVQESDSPAGVTINSYNGLRKLSGAHAAATLIAYAADVFNLSGNLSP